MLPCASCLATAPPEVERVPEGSRCSADHPPPGFTNGHSEPSVANLAHWRTHFLGRLAQHIAITGDSELSASLRELREYPSGDGEAAAQREIEASCSSRRTKSPRGPSRKEHHEHG